MTVVYRGKWGGIAIELREAWSKCYLSYAPLEVVRTMHGGFWSWLFALLTSAYWRAAEHLLQFGDNLDGRPLAVQQLDQTVFDGVIGDRVIDPFGSIVLRTLLGQGLLSGFG